MLKLKTCLFQMGLFVDLNPEEMMMDADENLDDPDLEAELAAITGNTVITKGRVKPKGKSKLSFFIFYEIM